jgi:GDP-L-fucose synthase
MEQGAKIFVAGHRGLAGSAIVRALEARGFTNLLLRTHAELNLINQKQTADFFTHEMPEYVFLAAGKTGGIMAAATEPALFLYENSMIQNNVMEAAYRSGVKKLLFIGSSCVYPRDCPQPIKEEYLMTGPLERTNDAFALGKIEGIYTCGAYNRQYGTNYIAAMPSNLYGINDSYAEFSHVLPSLMRKFHTAKMTGAKEVILWGTGRPLREFLHTDDFADACLFLMSTYNSSDIINVGPGEDLSIMDLALTMKQVVGYEGQISWDTSKPDGTPRKLLDVSKINELGWKHAIELKDGLRTTYDWFKRHYDL